MDRYVVILVFLGLSMLSMAWMPVLSRKIKISYSILYLVFGMLVFKTMDILPSPNPFLHLDFTVHITELVVIVSLMGCGLKIDERFSISRWKIPIRLVSVTMLITIALVAMVGYYMFDLDVPAAILLGAVLAPTDPVLADDVQVGPPLEKNSNDVRFSLTAEAGMNDGMAFPFTWLAIALASRGITTEVTWEWFYFDFIYRIIVGFAVGFGIGKVIAKIIFSLPHQKEFMLTRGGFIAISLTLLVYGITELVSGYGFIAVFVCAVTLRNYELEHEFHIELHAFTDQIERMLMAVVLVLFGGSLIIHVLPDVSWRSLLFAVILLFLIRPLGALPSFIRSDYHVKERMAIAFYGIRGIGSFFYLSFALQKAEFRHAEQLWDTVSLVIFFSVIIHGLSANSVMARLEKQFMRDRLKPD